MPQRFHRFAIEDTTSGLGHKDQMDVHRKDTVSTVS